MSFFQTLQVIIDIMNRHCRRAEISKIKISMTRYHFEKLSLEYVSISTCFRRVQTTHPFPARNLLIALKYSP